MGLEIAVGEAVEQEIHQIRHHGLSTFRLQKLYDMVVGQRGEFLLKSLQRCRPLASSSHRDSWQVVKVVDDAADNLTFESIIAGAFLETALDTAFFPFFMKGALAELRPLLVRTGGIKHPHEDIAENHRLHGLG